MTDKQIAKALECCTVDGEKDCFNCAETNWMSCQDTLMKQALDLINRLKSKIIELEHCNSILSINADTAFQDGLNESRDLYAKEVEMEIRAEAIKEFAYKLKDHLRFDDCEYDCENCCYACKDYVPFIDNLVEEMTEGKENA